MTSRLVCGLSQGFENYFLGEQVIKNESQKKKESLDNETQTRT